MYRKNVYSHSGTLIGFMVYDGIITNVYIATGTDDVLFHGCNRKEFAEAHEQFRREHEDSYVFSAKSTGKSKFRSDNMKVVEQPKEKPKLMTEVSRIVRNHTEMRCSNREATEIINAVPKYVGRLHAFRNDYFPNESYAIACVIFNEIEQAIKERRKGVTEENTPNEDWLMEKIIDIWRAYTFKDCTRSTAKSMVPMIVYGSGEIEFRSKFCDFPSVTLDKVRNMMEEMREAIQEWSTENPGKLHTAAWVSQQDITLNHHNSENRTLSHHNCRSDSRKEARDLWNPSQNSNVFEKEVEKVRGYKPGSGRCNPVAHILKTCKCFEKQPEVLEIQATGLDGRPIMIQRPNPKAVLNKPRRKKFM